MVSSKNDLVGGFCFEPFELFLTLQECGLEIKAVWKGCKVSEQDKEIVKKIIDTKNYKIEIKEAINNEGYKLANHVKE